MDETTAQSQPGEQLRLAREAHNLSIDDVATRLKLNAEKINALEQGDIQGLAAPVFVAGYIRTYARLLDLPEEEILGNFDLLVPVQESVIDSAAIAKDPVYGSATGNPTGAFSLLKKSADHHILLAGIIVVIILVLFLWPAGMEKPTRVAKVGDSKLEENAGQAYQDQSLGKQPSGEQPLSEQPLEVATENETGLTEESSVDTSSVIVDESNQSVAVEPISTFDALAIGMRSELTLVFAEDSWVEVTDARDQRLLYRLAKGGSTRTLTGVAPFIVQLGYVPGVSIVYNGENFDMSKYSGRRSVRLRIGEAGDRMGGE